jgi:hypothetical protein
MVARPNIAPPAGTSVEPCPSRPTCESVGVTTAELWRRGQLGWPQRFPIAQFPNAPLLVAFAGDAVAALTGGGVHDAGRAVFTLGLVVWASLEIAKGANWFRRLLGVGVLVWLAISLAA